MSTEMTLQTVRNQTLRSVSWEIFVMTTMMSCCNMFLDLTSDAWDLADSTCCS